MPPIGRQSRHLAMECPRAARGSRHFVKSASLQIFNSHQFSQLRSLTSYTALSRRRFKVSISIGQGAGDAAQPTVAQWLGVDHVAVIVWKRVVERARGQAAHPARVEVLMDIVGRPSDAEIGEALPPKGVAVPTVRTLLRIAVPQTALPRRCRWSPMSSFSCGRREGSGGRHRICPHDDALGCSSVEAGLSSDGAVWP